MGTIGQTKYSRLLWGALQKRKIDSQTEYHDGHKTVDLAIPEVGLYIEVDGIQHLNNAEQIITDFMRDYYSAKEGKFTLHIHNQDLKTHLNDIADAIAEVVEAKNINKA